MIYLKYLIWHYSDVFLAQFHWIDIRFGVSNSSHIFYTWFQDSFFAFSSTFGWIVTNGANLTSPMELLYVKLSRIGAPLMHSGNSLGMNVSNLSSRKLVQLFSMEPLFKKRCIQQKERRKRKAQDIFKSYFR